MMMSRAFTTEELDAIQEQALAGLYDPTAIKAIFNRLAYLKAQSVAVSTREDDRLVEIVLRQLRGAPEYDAMATLCNEVAYRQVQAFLSGLMVRMMIDRSDYVDYQQAVQSEIAARLSEYDSTRNRIPAFLASFIKGVLFLTALHT